MEQALRFVVAPPFTGAQIEALADPAFAVDHGGRIAVWNSAAARLLGWSADAAVGSTCASLLEGITPDGSDCRAGCPRAAGCVLAGPSHSNLRIHTIDGTGIDSAVIDLSIMLDGVPALLHILRPVGDFERDALTNLVGRRQISDSFAAAQSSTHRTGEPLSAALVDLDRLKRINDTYGHKVGDEALRQVAATLGEGRRHDHVARWGGDEFLLLALGATPEATVTRLERCLEVLRRAHVAPNGPTLSVSAGVTAVRPDETLDQVMERADSALYEAKHTRGTICLATNQRSGALS